MLRLEKQDWLAVKNLLSKLGVTEFRVMPRRLQAYAGEIVFFIFPDGRFGKMRSGQYGHLDLTTDERDILAQVYEIYKKYL